MEAFYESPFLCPFLGYHSTSHPSTSTPHHPPIIYVRANFLLKQSLAKLCTYIRSILHTYYVFVPHFLNSELLNSLLRAFNPACANIILHSTCQYTYLHIKSVFCPFYTVFLQDFLDVLFYIYFIYTYFVPFLVCDFLQFFFCVFGYLFLHILYLYILTHHIYIKSQKSTSNKINKNIASILFTHCKNSVHSIEK